MRLTIVNCGDPGEYAVVRYQPMAPAYIAACTPPPWSVEVVDGNWERFDPRACRADLVAFSAIPRHVHRAYADAAVLRARGIPTVAGGLHVSAVPDEALEHFDAVVEGEAEPVWPQVLADLERGRLRRHYRAGFDQPLDDLGLPDRRVIHPGYKLASVSTSRACNNGCSFCYMGSLRDRCYRTIPAETVVEDFRRVTQKLVVLTDANFLGFSDEDRESRLELCEALIRSGVKKYWAAQITADIVRHPELLAMLYRAGCRLAFIGFETVGRGALQSIDKDQYAPLDYTEVVRTVQAAGIGVAASLILGLDTHDRGYERELTRWLDEARPLFLNLGVLTPMPNTALYHQARGQGRLLADGLDLWPHVDKATTTLTHPRLSAAEVEEMFGNVVGHFFSNRSILRTFAHQLLVRRQPTLSLLYLASALRKRGNACKTLVPPAAAGRAAEVC